MKAETKSTMKNVAIVLVAMIAFAGAVWLLPAKVTLAVVLLMQLLTVIAIGGTNIRIGNEQKKQDA